MKKFIKQFDSFDFILLAIIVISFVLFFIRSIFAISKTVFIIALVILAIKKIIDLFQNK